MGTMSSPKHYNAAPPRIEDRFQTHGKKDMVRYTLAESPETVIEVSGKDSAKSRDKAMHILMQKLENDEVELPNGFQKEDFIEVTETQPSADTGKAEDEVTQAVLVLTNLANLKFKAQQTREEALEIRKLVDILFSDTELSEQDLNTLKNGFKTLKNYAHLRIQYQESLKEAETAREILDKALGKASK